MTAIEAKRSWPWARAASLYLSQPVDAASLAVFRILFGLLMAAGLIRFWAKGWIHELYLSPSFHFTYPGFHWVVPWPAAWIYSHVLAAILAALCLAAGFFTRLSALAFFLLFTYLELIDKTYYLNHYYFVSLISFLLIFLPTNQLWALDSRPHPSRTPTVPQGAVLLLQLQLALVYTFAGLAKFNSDWLLHAQPLRTWLPAHADLPWIGSWLNQVWVAYAMSWSGMIYDLSIPWLLWWGRTRPWAYATVLVFHVATALLFPIGMFPWIMIAATLVFFPPDWPRRCLNLAPTEPRPEHPQHSAPPAPYRAFPKTALAAAFYLSLQLVIPLRHLAYPGDVLWTEQGFRFSWRVMLVEKGASAEFRILDPASGRSWHVEPSDYLTPLQEKMMSTQPDMIVDFARFLYRKNQALYGPDVQVQVDSWVSLNGRPSTRLFKPDVNLATLGAAGPLHPALLPSPRNRSKHLLDSPLSYFSNSTSRPVTP